MNKKELELYWLERARRIRPDLFAGKLETGEAPDFVINRPELRIGVEITRYANTQRAGEPIPEEQTGLRHKVLDVAKRQFAASSSTRLRVGAVFNSSPSLRADRVPIIARAIVAYLVARIDAAPDWSRVRWTAGDDDEPSLLPPELATLFATVIPSVGNAHWYPAQAGWVSHADDTEIARIVVKKEKKVARYRQRCDELILVIVFDGKPHSARATHAPITPVPFSISTEFARVYCLDTLEDRLVEVPVLQQVATAEPVT